MKKAMVTYNVIIAFILYTKGDVTMTKVYFNHDGGVDDLVSLFYSYKWRILNLLV